MIRIPSRDGAIGFRRTAVAAVVTLIMGGLTILTTSTDAQAGDVSGQLSLPSSSGSNISLTGGPHNWSGCGYQPGDCLINHPWNSVDWQPADGKVYASHSGIAHIYDCPAVNGHYSFVRIDYNDGSNYQVTYEHVHYVEQQVYDGETVSRGQYLGTTSTDSNCGGSATGAHTHMSLWNFSGAFTKDNSQAVDFNGVQIGAWLLDDGSPTQEMYTGCFTPTTGGSRQCPTARVNNNGTVPLGSLTTAYFYLRNSNTSGNPDISFQYGAASDIPVVGDWTGQCMKTPGVFRRGYWYLRNSNSSGTADISFNYGAPSGDAPIVGDWTGQLNPTTGCRIDTPGVFRGATWLLRNSNTTGTADITFIYGASTDVPVVGDWTGQGYSTPGVFRNATWLLRNSNTSGTADITFTYGASSDVPVVGDWTGQGYTTPGVFRSATWYLRNSNSSGSADITFVFEASTDTPLAGDWTGQTNPWPPYRKFDTAGAAR